MQRTYNSDPLSNPYISRNPSYPFTITFREKDNLNVQQIPHPTIIRSLAFLNPNSKEFIQYFVMLEVCIPILSAEKPISRLRQDLHLVEVSVVLLPP